MTYIELMIIVLIIAMIISGIFLLKRTANKFNLSAEQLKKIKQRNKILDEKEKN